VTAPAERLLAAADLLDKRAGEATEDWQLDDDNHLALLAITTPYSIGAKWRPSGARYSFTGPDDATTAYIATMNPEVGKAIAAWLRSEAQAVRGGEGRGFDGANLYLANPRSLALADLLLAGES
jgi:hypothetical protein